MTKPNKNWEERFKKEWLKIVDLIANARGIVDLVTAEQKAKQFIKTLMIDILEEVEEDKFQEVYGDDNLSTEFVYGYSAKRDEINQKIEEIKKRFK